MDRIFVADMRGVHMIRNSLFSLKLDAERKSSVLVYQIQEINFLYIKPTENDELLFVVTDKDIFCAFSVKDIKNGKTEPVVRFVPNINNGFGYDEHGIWSMDYNPDTMDLFLGSNKRRVDVS